MDVTKPGKIAANPTSRPIIIGHGSIIKDPVVKQEADNGLEAQEPAQAHEPYSIKSTGKTVQPLSALQSEQSAKAKEPSIPESEPKPKTSPATDAKQPEPPSEKAAGSDAEATAVSDGDAAIVDAVAEQAGAGKKQKEEDEAEAKRKEVLEKLIAEKKYFLPIKQQSVKSRGSKWALILALVLVSVAAAYCLIDAGIINAGIKMPLHIFTQKEASTGVESSIAAPTATAVTATNDQSALVAYASKDYGVAFSYPKAWGDVSAKQMAGTVSGKTVTFTFAKQPMMRAGMLSRDYKELGRDGTCHLLYGIMPGTTLADMHSYIKNGDNPDNNQTFKDTTKILKDTPDTFIYERFETGSVAMGGCPGVSITGYKSFSTGSYTGIEFLWSDVTEKPVSTTNFAKYIANPNDFLSEQNRKDILAVIASAKISP